MSETSETTDEGKLAKVPDSFRRREARDRRERIATAVLVGLAGNPARINMPINDDVRAAIVSADMLIEKLDEEGGR